MRRRWAELAYTISSQPISESKFPSSIVGVINCLSREYSASGKRSAVAKAVSKHAISTTLLR